MRIGGLWGCHKRPGKLTWQELSRWRCLSTSLSPFFHPHGAKYEHR
jgi:hypothetical protein